MSCICIPKIIWSNEDFSFSINIPLLNLISIPERKVHYVFEGVAPKVWKSGSQCPKEKSVPYMYIHYHIPLPEKTFFAQL